MPQIHTRQTRSHSSSHHPLPGPHNIPHRLHPPHKSRNRNHRRLQRSQHRASLHAPQPTLSRTVHTRQPEEKTGANPRGEAH